MPQLHKHLNVVGKHIGTQQNYISHSSLDTCDILQQLKGARQQANANFKKPNSQNDCIRTTEKQF
jgi:hypothetical protein